MKRKMVIVLIGLFATISVIRPVQVKAEKNEMRILATPTPGLQTADHSSSSKTEEETDTREMRIEYEDGSWSVFYPGQTAAQTIGALGLSGQLSVESSFSQVVGPLSLTSRDTYDPRELKNSRVYYDSSGAVTAVLEECYNVWYFTSLNRVHIYSWGLTLHTAAGYENSRVNYGNVINTDGSVSYTENTSVDVIGRGTNTHYPIYFVVTPSYFNFY